MARKGETLSVETRAKITGRPRSERAGASAIHTALRKDHPLAGRCESCAREGRTELAFLHHPAPHTRNREDYRELCRSCHFKFDEPTIKRTGAMAASNTRERLQEAGRKGAAARWNRREMIANG